MRRRNRSGRVTTMLAVAAATVLSVVPAAGAADDAAPAAEGVAEAQGLRWVVCDNGGTHVIFRRTGGYCTDDLDSVGFAALHRQPGGYRLQVCATGNDTMGMRVDPADEHGNSTGDVIYYSDEPYGPCFNRDIGYPVRKFQAVHLWFDGVYFSSWMLPPS